MLGSLKKLANNVIKSGESLLNRVVDRNLFKRVVFTAYLIASADGDFDSDERKALVKLIKKDLPDFDTNDIIELIRICDEKVAFDKALGTQEILDEIALSAESPEDSKQIMRVCQFIGASDGDYDKDEKLMARSIAYALKLNPVNFNL